MHDPRHINVSRAHVQETWARDKPFLPTEKEEDKKEEETTL